MIRRIRRTPPWFGAVAALLLLALPAQADDIEPEPYVEEALEPEPEPEAEVVPEPEVEVEEEAEPENAAETGRDTALAVFDLVLIRPFYFTRWSLGLPFFVFYPLTLGSGYDEDVVALLWTEPFEATFLRPLGEPLDDY
jgi:hypothetical protein